MKKSKFLMAGAAVTVLAALSGCGGGSSDANGNHAAPTLTATLPTAATAGVAVTISGITAANATAVTVDWGDGSQDAPATIPTSLTHTYAASATCVTAGKCSIDLAALGWGTAAEVKGDVTITPAPTLAATLPTIGTAGAAVTVSDISAANATALSIDWGDGTTETAATTSTSLTHTYGAAGTYTIDMVLTGANSSSVEKKGSITINSAAEPALVATLPTSGVTGNAVSVTGISTSNGTAMTVNWGDGTTESADVSATSLSHTYAATGTYSIVLTLDGPASSTPVQQTGSITIDTPELFFSEYVEGSSNNKALEIYNPTSSAVDLSLYSVQMWSRSASGVPVASTATQTLALTGTLAAGKTLVIYNASSSTTLTSAVTASGTLVQADGTYASTNGHQVTSFNGNDTVFLLKSGTVIDAIGATTDLASGATGPTAGWGTADASGTMLTVDHSLRRKAGIGRGTPSLDETWDPTVQWDVYAKDTFTGLGQR